MAIASSMIVPIPPWLPVEGQDEDIHRGQGHHQNSLQVRNETDLVIDAQFSFSRNKAVAGFFVFFLGAPPLPIQEFRLRVSGSPALPPCPAAPMKERKSLLTASQSAPSSVPNHGDDLVVKTFTLHVCR